MRNRHLRESPTYLDALDGSRQLNDWASVRTSNLVMIKGTFRDRGKAKHIAASIVASARQSPYPIVWILAPPNSIPSQQLSNLDILKQLVLQILQKNNSLLDDQSKPLLARDFQCATTESEWFDLLSLVLIGIAEIYIVIDIEILRGNLTGGQMWPLSFIRLFEKLVTRSPNTIVKVAIISYHTQLAIEGTGLTQKNVVKLNKRRHDRKGPNKSSSFQITSSRRRQA
jgi:hypothetical protein